MKQGGNFTLEARKNEQLDSRWDVRYESEFIGGTHQCSWKATCCEREQEVNGAMLKGLENPSAAFLEEMIMFSLRDQAFGSDSGYVVGRTIQQR